MVVPQIDVVNNGIDKASSKKVDGKPIKSKNQLRRLKQKQRKLTVRSSALRSPYHGAHLTGLTDAVLQEHEKPTENGAATPAHLSDEERPSNVEYVSEQLDLSDAGLEAFSDVFARFQLPPEESSVSVGMLIALIPL